MDEEVLEVDVEVLVDEETVLVVKFVLDVVVAVFEAVVEELDVVVVQASTSGIVMRISPVSVTPAMVRTVRAPTSLLDDRLTRLSSAIGSSSADVGFEPVASSAK